MNAAYKAERNAQFCYPGTNYIGHGGDFILFHSMNKGVIYLGMKRTISEIRNLIMS